jgi:hypothetical protein
MFTDQPDGDEEPRGFDASRIIWEFFKRFRRPESTEEVAKVSSG